MASVPHEGERASALPEGSVEVRRGRGSNKHDEVLAGLAHAIKDERLLGVECG